MLGGNAIGWNIILIARLMTKIVSVGENKGREICVYLSLVY